MNLKRDYFHGHKLIQMADYNISAGDVISGDGIVYAHAHDYEKMAQAIEQSPYTHTVITHNSDHSVLVNPPTNVRAWFAQNGSGGVIHLPIGIEPPGVGTCGDISVIVEHAYSRVAKITKCYMNFSTATNPTMRMSCYNALKGKPFITDQMGTRISFPEYIKRMSRHQFVISPPGNGLDCIRTWEALYCGTIPVVHRSPAMEFFEKYLPILIVDEWDEVSPQYLADGRRRLLARRNKMDLLDINFWERCIREGRWIEP